MDEDAWPLKMEARLTAMELMLSGMATATGTRHAIARALEIAAHKVVSDAETIGSDPEYRALLLDACLDIARRLYGASPEDSHSHFFDDVPENADT